MTRLTEGDRKNLFEFGFAAVATLVYLGLSALLLWPLGKAALSIQLGKGFLVFWIVLCLTFWLLLLLRKVFRIEDDPPSGAYVTINLIVGAVLQAGWAAFAALTVHALVAGTGRWVGLALWVIGFLASYVGFILVGAFFQGQLYKLVNAIIALAGFILFALWPALAQAVFGWFLRFF